MESDWLAGLRFPPSALMVTVMILHSSPPSESGLKRPPPEMLSRTSCKSTFRCPGRRGRIHNSMSAVEKPASKTSSPESSSKSYPGMAVSSLVLYMQDIFPESPSCLETCKAQLRFSSHPQETSTKSLSKPMTPGFRALVGPSHSNSLLLPLRVKAAKCSQASLITSPLLPGSVKADRRSQASLASNPEEPRVPLSTCTMTSSSCAPPFWSSPCAQGFHNFWTHPMSQR
mmetsp:Transcript_26857/g.43094  ORF Transcript_26857/g.43094 Transcript_26857/m.43094 type:complete len:229 (+) Transcript_26857:1080-1766(+)